MLLLILLLFYSGNCTERWTNQNITACTVILETNICQERVCLLFTYNVFIWKQYLTYATSPTSRHVISINQSINQSVNLSINRPDMTFAVDWALNTSSLSIYQSISRSVNHSTNQSVILLCHRLSQIDSACCVLCVWCLV